MTSDAVTWVVAGLEVLAAILVGVFWVTWFREPHTEPWLPAGYREHESPFVFSDTMMSIVLVAAAVLQVTEQPAGRSLGLIAAGMLAFLGVLDLAYFARTGLFKREHGGATNAAVVGGVLVLAAILTIRFI